MCSVHGEMWCAGSPVANVDGVVIKESNEILEAFFFLRRHSGGECGRSGDQRVERHFGSN